MDAELTAKSNIAAIVVTYNRKELLRQCLGHILAQQDAVCDILVMDNASADGTEGMVRDMLPMCPAIRYHNTGENLGGAGGFQAGIKLAARMGYQYVWLMDDDTLPSKTALAALLHASEKLNGGYGFLSGAALWTDNTPCRMNLQKKVKPKKAQIALAEEGIIPISQATFVSLFLPIQNVREFGLPIKEFFIWGDDIEYTRRIAVRGKLPGYLVAQSRAVHATKNNVGSSIAKDEFERLERYHFAYRNENYLYRKEGVRGVLFYYAKCFFHLAKILFTARDHRCKRGSIVLKQMVKGLAFNPSIEFLE